MGVLGYILIFVVGFFIFPFIMSAAMDKASEKAEKGDSGCLAMIFIIVLIIAVLGMLAQLKECSNFNIDEPSVRHTQVEIKHTENQLFSILG